MFMRPRMSRKADEIEAPIMFPVFVKASNLLDIAFAVAATTIDVIITILISQSRHH